VNAMGTALSTRGKPKGLLRLFLRAPILLYRARLGWLLGGRFLLLEHLGRTSGKRRRTVIEVVDHDEATGAYFVCSGWGRGSDWFRNVQKTPEVRVTVGLRRFEARARELDADQAHARLSSYGARHPKALAQLAKMMLGEAPADLGTAVAQLVEAVPVVELAPHPS